MLKTESLLELAIKAGEEILDVYGQDFAVTIKDDNSPVTDADTRAEAVIIEGLEALAPGVPVVAEEAVAAGDTPPSCHTFFLVDPLDGSKEFVSRNGEFTVNIALVSDGKPVLGVVYAPALGRIWWGGIGEGAHRGEVADGKIVNVRPIACAPCGTKGLRVVGSRSHSTPEFESYLKTVDVADFVAAGSSLKFCLLAEGEADLYPRFGRTMEWDTAAGDAVLRAAGGQVKTLDEADLVYGKRDQSGDTDFANPFFIASVPRK